VLSLPDGTFRLVAADGRELVRLDDAERTAKTAALTPDGTKLVVGVGDGLRVWDLRAIRRQLAAIDLDWDEPPDPPPVTDGGGPLEVTVLRGDVLADAKAGRDYERGLATLRLAADPFDTAAHLALGRLDSFDGQFAAAHTHFGMALLARPDSHDAYAGRGRAAHRLGRPADAVADLSEALRLNPVDERPRQLRATLLLALGRPADAEADWTALIERHPADAELYDRRAACRAATGDATGADADRRAAAEREPASAYGLNERAWRLVAGSLAERDLPRGLALAQKAVAAAPDNPLYRNTLGVALYRAGRPGEAVPALEKSLAARPGRANAFDLYYLALCHHALGDAAKARDCFERAVQWRKTATPRPHQVQELDALHAEAADALVSRSPP
jgi:tetratricopeptide (TPR) repeat protein